MLDKLKRLFTGHKEDDSIPKGIEEVILDDIHLCSTCPMKGRCELPNGCVSFNNLQEQRKKKILQLRGARPEDPKPADIYYIKGLSWSSEYRQIIYRYKVTFLDGTIAKIKVTQSKQVPGMNARGQMRLQVIKDDIINVRVPLVTTSEGRRVVDIQALKKAAIEELSTWRPSSYK